MNLKILLVEDNENNRYLAQFLLERKGCIVCCACNGKEALTVARNEQPDLVVMDIRMPEMDGYETARRFKEDPMLAEIPLVGVSSFAMPGDRAAALDLGFAGYVEKPIDPETFVSEITQFSRVAH